MGKKKKKYQTNQANEVSIPGIVTSMWVYLMFTLFPLIYHDYYFDILETKTYTFIALTVTMIGAMLLWLIASGELVKTFRKTESFGFSVTDWSMLIFWAVAVISTLAAGEYMSQAFWGTEGRYVGCFFISLITASYFLVTRYLKFSKHMITAFLCTAWLMCLFGITDFYNMNLLHFKDRIRETQYNIFTSFIGNINSYTVYAGFAVVIATVLFVMSRESVKRTAFYFASMIVAMMGLTMGSSDNGYLTIAALFGFLPLAAFRTRTGLRRYVAVLAVYFTDIAWIWHVEQSRTAAGLSFVRIDGLFNHIAKLSFLPAVILLLWALYAALLVWEIRKGKGQEDAELPRVLRVIWLALIALAVCVILWLIVTANAGTKQEALDRFGAVGTYLYFDDDWGTQRGYVWRACMEEYSELNIFHKLIGTGPDSFSVQMILHRYKEMLEATGQIYDSAHNEFLQYLYSVGILGLIAYLGQLTGSIVTAAKTALCTGRGQGTREPYYAAYLWAFGFAVLCYASQSLVNINIPVVSPLLWIFMMFTESMAREVRGKQKPEQAKEEKQKTEQAKEEKQKTKAK